MYKASAEGLRAACIGCTKERTKREHHLEAAVETGAQLPDSLDELRALERDVEREWWWLNGALNAVAQCEPSVLPVRSRVFVRCRLR